MYPSQMFHYREPHRPQGGRCHTCCLVEHPGVKVLDSRVHGVLCRLLVQHHVDIFIRVAVRRVLVSEDIPHALREGDDEGDDEGAEGGGYLDKGSSNAAMVVNSITRTRWEPTQLLYLGVQTSCSRHDMWLMQCGTPHAWRARTHLVHTAVHDVVEILHVTASLGPEIIVFVPATLTEPHLSASGPFDGEASLTLHAIVTVRDRVRDSP